MILMVKFFYFHIFDAWPVSFTHLKGLVYDILHFDCNILGYLYPVKTPDSDTWVSNMSQSIIL